MLASLGQVEVLGCDVVAEIECLRGVGVVRLGEVLVAAVQALGIELVRVVFFVFAVVVLGTGLGMQRTAAFVQNRGTRDPSNGFRS